MQSTSAFWKLVSIHFLGCVSHAIVIIYIIPIAVLAGMEEVAAAGVLSTLALVSVSTRFLTPVISDYIGSRGTMATAFVWQGLPVLMLFWAHDPWQFYLFAVIFGIGYGGEGSAFPVINRQYFGRGPMGSSFGWQQFGAGSGMAMGAWLGGALFWLFDSYAATIIISTATSLAGAVLDNVHGADRTPPHPQLGRLCCPISGCSGRLSVVPRRRFRRILSLITTITSRWLFGVRGFLYSLLLAIRSFLFAVAR